MASISPSLKRRGSYKKVSGTGPYAQKKRHIERLADMPFLIKWYE